MEQENALPSHIGRRAMLAQLLGIPFYLSSSSVDTKPAAPRKRPTYNLKESEQTLCDYWQAGLREADPSQLWQHLRQQRRNLEQAVLYGDQKKQAGKLLSEYLLLCSNLLRDQGYPQKALPYVEKALLLSQERQEHELEAKALYLKGYCLFDLAGIQPEVHDRSIIQQGFLCGERALLHLQQKGIESELLHVAILAQHGLATSYMAQDTRDCYRAQILLNRAETLSRQENRPDPAFFRVDSSWVTIDTIEASLARNEPARALETISSLERTLLPTLRRYSYLLLLTGEAYFAKGCLEMGVASFEALLQRSYSYSFLLRMQHFYEKVRAQHRGNQDLARLGGLLLRAHSPELFS